MAHFNNKATEIALHNTEKQLQLKRAKQKIMR